MKKLFILSIITASALFVNAQVNNGLKIGKNANKFFKSYEDYKADKAVEGITLVRDETNEWKYKYIEVMENGVKKKIEPKQLQYPWFCDQFGMLTHVYDGEFYSVIVDGPLCFYFKIETARARELKTGNYSIELAMVSQAIFKEYYSETINGEIVNYKEKKFEEFLEKYGLTEQYKSDKPKRELHDSEWGYRVKMMNRTIKYFKLLNEKMK